MEKKLKILVINLKSSSERRAIISKQLDSLGIPYEFLEATEGNKLTDEWIGRNIGNRLKYVYYNNIHYSVNKNALACADSHRRAQLIAASFSDGYTLILEDDVVISKLFRKEIIDIINLMQKHSINIAFPGYNLARGSVKKRVDVNCSGVSFSLFNYPIDGHVSGAYSYIVSSNGAKKLVNDNLEKIEDTADWFYINEKGLGESTVILYPKIVTTGYIDSDIGYINPNANLVTKTKRAVYRLSIKSKTVHYFLCHWKRRRW